MLEQAIGETSGGCSYIKGAPSLRIHLKGVECLFQLESPPAGIGVILSDNLHLSRR
jgi:hypothetical protein